MPQSIPTLQELAFMYSTDKLDHGYIPFYEKWLPKNPKKILEIGVKSGASIKMWLKYFPDSLIHGLDLFKEFPVPFQDERVTWHQGNQCNWELLEQLRKEDFDITIDDGSHNSRDQMITFFGLFNGKQYYIEDTHCCSDPFYQDGLPFEATAENFLFSGLNIYRSKNIVLIDNLPTPKCSGENPHN
jgi:hypothetical protein